MTEEPKNEETPETPDAADAAGDIAGAAADAEQAETPEESADAAPVAAAAGEVAERPEDGDEISAEADTDAEADDDDDEVATEAEKPAKRRGLRRGSAEAGAAKKQRSSRRPRPDAEPVFVRAQAKYVRSSPRKARLVVDHIRGKSVEEARAILTHTPRAAAVPVLKVLESAIANAEHNHELLPDELRVHQVMVDEGPTIKRYRPRALGRATKIRKRTSHITINLTNKA